MISETFGNAQFDPTVWGYTISALDEETYAEYKTNLQDLVTFYNFTYNLEVAAPVEA